MKKVIAKTAAGRPLILYLVRHEDGREITVHGRNKYEAVTAAARKWGVPWTSIYSELKKECMETCNVRVLPCTRKERSRTTSPPYASHKASTQK